MADEQENKENEPLNLNEDELKEEFEFLKGTQEENENSADENLNSSESQNDEEQNQEPPAEEHIKQTVAPQKKGPKKIVIIAGAVFTGVILFTAGLYFGGFFSHKDTNTTKKHDANITKKEKYVFDADHINDLRLNLKLSILNQTGLTPEQKAKLLSDADSNETMIYDKETMKLIALEESINLDDTPSEENLTKTEANETKKVEKATPELFIQIAYVKSENLKLPKLDSEKFGAKVSICKDSKNMAQILIGPFENESNQKKSLGQIRKIKQFDDAFTTKLTQADYEKKCSF